MIKYYFFQSLLIILFFHTPIIAQEYDSLAEAVYNKDIDKINILLDSGIDVNITTKEYPSTVLFIACSFKDFDDIVSYLISKGADINIKGKDGKTPLMLAASNSLESTKILLEHGANVKAKADDGMTAFLQCTFGVISNKVTTDVMDLLLKNGANVNDALSGKDTPGWTALMLASINGDYDLAKYLIIHGANVNHTSNEGITALTLAKQEKYDNIVMLLKKHGALE